MPKNQAIPADYRILLVEDEPIGAKVAAESLRQLGYKVTWADSGSTALELARKGECDLVLLDIDLPDISGVEVARRIREGEAGTQAAAVKIFALTSHNIGQMQGLCKAVGMNGYFHKPIDPTRIQRIFDCSADQFIEPGELSESSNGVMLEKVKPAHRALLPAVLESLRQLWIELDESLAEGGMENARRTGHRIKGVGATFGLPMFVRIGDAIEMSAVDGSREELEEIRQPLEEMLDRLKEEIDEILDESGVSGQYN